MHALNDVVVALLRAVAAEHIMPRYRNLVASEIDEKTPGELVTIADRASEVALTAGLLPLIVGARVVGEEACAADPALLDTIVDGVVWIVDPIDGTANFAKGVGPFGIIIALVANGVTQAGWLYDPVLDRVSHAVASGGAFSDGVRVQCSGTDNARPIASIGSQFLEVATAATVHAEAARHFDLVSLPRCAAEHYPRLVRGDNDVAIFHRTLPWDHAAGALFLREAGGFATRWDGSDYALGDDKQGMIAATNEAVWRQALVAVDAAGLNARFQKVNAARP